MLAPHAHTIPSIRLRNEAQLTHFPCSPAPSTSCLFIELHISMLPQLRLYSTLPSVPICGVIALRNLKCMPRMQLLSQTSSKMQTCHWTFVMLLGCYCLLFSFSAHLSLRVQGITISEPSSDSLAIQSLRKQKAHIPHGTLSSGLIWRHVGNSAVLPLII